MGESSDMISVGVLCQECGQYIDDDGDPRTVGADGYPRFCSDCGGDPDTNYAAKRQRKKHTGNRFGPKCPECGKRLRSDQGLTDHRRDVHGMSR